MSSGLCYQLAEGRRPIVSRFARVIAADGGVFETAAVTFCTAQNEKMAHARPVVAPPVDKKPPVLTAAAAVHWVCRDLSHLGGARAVGGFRARHCTLRCTLALARSTRCSSFLCLIPPDSSEAVGRGRFARAVRRAVRSARAPGSILGERWPFDPGRTVARVPSHTLPSKQIETTVTPLQ